MNVFLGPEVEYMFIIINSSIKYLIKLFIYAKLNKFILYVIQFSSCRAVATAGIATMLWHSAKIYVEVFVGFEQSARLWSVSSL